MSKSIANRLRGIATAQNMPRQFVRFLLVAGSFAGLYILLASILMDWALLPAWGASALAYGMFIAPAYLAQKSFAFQSRARNSIAFPRYVLLQFGSLLSASFTAQVIQTNWLIPSLYISSASVAVAVVVNFFLLKIWVLAES